MSCYEWEKGTFKLSVQAYAKFKSDFYEKYNKAVEEDFALLENFHAELLEKIKANTDKKVSAKNIANAMLSEHSSKYGYSASPKYAFKTISDYTVISLLLEKKEQQGEGVNARIVRTDRKSPVSPKKKDFKGLSASKDLCISETSFSDARVYFDPKERTVTWQVDENNHACEHARESFLGRLFFSLLKQVTWTRATGGVVFGNNEYHREASENDPWGRQNIIKECFGPLSEEYKKPISSPRRKY